MTVAVLELVLCSLVVGFLLALIERDLRRLRAVRAARDPGYVPPWLRERILAAGAIADTLQRIAELSIAYQEGRITAHDYAETTARVLAEAGDRVRPFAGRRPA